MGALSTDAILEAAASAVRAHRAELPETPWEHLDIGPGDGALITLLRERFGVRSRACDAVEGLMRVRDVAVEPCDINRQALPYADDTFELVTLTEVIEHLDHHRFALGEIRRVLRPGGLLVLSTPNILSLSSRMRYLVWGFWDLYGPLRFDRQRPEDTHGHVNPIGLFHVAHSLAVSGLDVLSARVDRHKRSALLWLPLLWVPVRIAARYHLRREAGHYGTLHATNRPWAERMNQTDILLGRTIIVAARKPPA
jgi:SAM-dependent methyltransferase